MCVARSLSPQRITYTERIRGWYAPGDANARRRRKKKRGTRKRSVPSVYKECETCIYCNVGKEEQPCCYCVEGMNYEKGCEENG